MRERAVPRPLRPGDAVALVSPSGPSPHERVDLAVRRVEAWGLRAVVGPHARDRHPDLPWLAGTDADRAADLQTALTDPGVRAVWAVRGGDGAQRLLPLLDLDAVREAWAADGPRHLVGFSDITSLHARVGRELDVVTWHGPVASGAQLDDGPTADAMRAALLGPAAPGARLCAGSTVVAGDPVDGRLAGGNLALVDVGVGVEPAPDEPTVVVLEDVGEEAYRIERMLTRLRLVGWFDHVVGVVLGSFTEPGRSTPAMVDAALLDGVGDLGVPVLRTDEVGHGDRNLALPLGARVRLDAGAAGGVLSLAG